MRLSHSRVKCHETCPYQYKLKYIDKLKTLPKYDPQDALILGTSLHTGIEKTIEDALIEYYSSYPVISDLHENEAIKLEHILKRIKEVLPEGLHEVKIEDEDYIGYIDLLVPVDDNTYDLYDFKYSNNVGNYMQSEQLHLYKYYFEKLNPSKHIRNMYFMFAPKTFLRQKYKNKSNPRDETLFEFRSRMIEDLKKKEIQFVKIDYEPEKVIEFLTKAKHCIEDTEFEKNPTRLCDWCEYKDYCEKGDMSMIVLPKNERQTGETVNKKKLWIYGAPFSGKTHLANEFPDLLLLSTDGNYRNLPKGIPPHIDIADIVTTEGRMTKRTFAWEVFKETIAELEKNQNDFKTVALDLVEDAYESCRLYMYDQLGITHESDDSFRAWDKVRTEFLSTMRRFFNLNYENIIIISHEDASKDITKRSGDKITSIKPNINDKCANKLSGMVDIVMRTIAEDSKYILSFKTSEVIFGGGRLDVQANEIENDYDALMEVYDEANEGKIKPHDAKDTKLVNTTDKEQTTDRADESASEDEPKQKRTRKKAEQVEEVSEEKPKARRRKKAELTSEELENAAAEAEAVIVADFVEEVEEKPKRRTRKKRD